MLLIGLFGFDFKVKLYFGDGMEGFLEFDICSLVFMPPNRQISINFVNVIYEGC